MRANVLSLVLHAPETTSTTIGEFTLALKSSEMMITTGGDILVELSTHAIHSAIELFEDGTVDVGVKLGNILLTEPADSATRPSQTLPIQLVS